MGITKEEDKGTLRSLSQMSYDIFVTKVRSVPWNQLIDNISSRLDGLIGNLHPIKVELADVDTLCPCQHPLKDFGNADIDIAVTLDGVAVGISYRLDHDLKSPDWFMISLGAARSNLQITLAGVRAAELADLSGGMVEDNGLICEPGWVTSEKFLYELSRKLNIRM